MSDIFKTLSGETIYETKSENFPGWKIHGKVAGKLEGGEAYELGRSEED